MRTRSGSSSFAERLRCGHPKASEYLDSGKIGVDDATGEGILLSRPGPNLEYWDGED